MRRVLTLLTELLPLAAASTGVSAGEYRDIAFGGEERRYYVHAPERLPENPAPLVLVLHGAGGSGDGAVQRYGWEAQAEESGFIVAGPEAMPVRPDREARFFLNPRIWNDGSGRGPAETVARDDVGYLAAVIAAIAAQHRIDATRVFVTGFSNGSSMTHRLGAARPDLLTAIAPYAGAYWPGHEGAERALPVLYLTGDADPLNPIAGGPLDTPWGPGKAKPPVRDTLLAWAARLGCAPETETAPGPAPAVRMERWSGCRGDGALVYAEIGGLGHHWAGAGDSGMPERWVGPYAETGFDATAFIWDFFAAAPPLRR